MLELDVDFLSVIDNILIYHRAACIDMHVQDDPKAREKEYNKAEASREIIMLLGKEMLKKNDQKGYQVAIQERLSALYQSVFFDPNTRKRIQRAKEADNGG